MQTKYGNRKSMMGGKKNSILQVLQVCIMRVPEEKKNAGGGGRMKQNNIARNEKCI